MDDPLHPRSRGAHTLEVSRLDLTSVPVSELAKLPGRLTRLAANYCGLTVEATTALLTAVTRTSNTTTELGIIRWVWGVLWINRYSYLPPLSYNYSDILS